jgi:hypothetical protein
MICKAAAFFALYKGEKWRAALAGMKIYKDEIISV